MGRIPLVIEAMDYSSFDAATKTGHDHFETQGLGRLVGQDFQYYARAIENHKEPTLFFAVGHSGPEYLTQVVKFDYRIFMFADAVVRPAYVYGSTHFPMMHHSGVPDGL